MIARYLVFAGDSFYPCGGWGDFMGSFDTLLAAHEAANARTPAGRRPKYDWAQVIDVETGDEIEFVKNGPTI